MAVVTIYSFLSMCTLGFVCICVSMLLPFQALGSQTAVLSSLPSHGDSLLLGSQALVPPAPDTHTSHFGCLLVCLLTP